MSSAVSLHTLHYTYPNAAAHALDGVDLDADGGITLLTGASGSGKSTLLRVCNGLVPHFHGGAISGTARVCGRDVLRTPTREMAREVGFVFQDPELQSVYSRVERDVAFGLENLRIPRATMQRRVDAALELCGIEHLRHRAVAGLSGGERQRLALAGVLAMQPRLLVLDEPLSQLDAEGAVALLLGLDAVAQQGTTILVAEQRRRELQPHAQRALFIEHGYVAETDARAHDAARPAGDEMMPMTARDVNGGRGWLRLAGVSAGHARIPLLDGVDLFAGPGDVIALVGPNGSGKTTLLRTIAGLLQPLAGRVERAPGRIAYLPQNPAALLHRETVRAEIAWTLRGSPTVDVDATLRAFGIAPFAQRYPRDLSTGERQRVALAAVLCGCPSIALLDEPTRGMDEHAQADLVRVVHRITATAGCVVIATHDAALASAVATRVVRVDAGTAREAHPVSAVPA